MEGLQRCAYIQLAHNDFYQLTVDINRKYVLQSWPTKYNVRISTKIQMYIFALFLTIPL